MARDKAKDDRNFNCGQQHELNYVSGLYSERERVYSFLVTKCVSNEIKYSTHMEVYELIKRQLGLPIPN